MVADSMRNCDMTSPRRAPSALRTPISRVRSVTETSMMFMMTMPPMTSEMAARRDEDGEEAGADALPDADEGLIGVDGEAVLCARGVVAEGAQDDADLIGGELQWIADAIGARIEGEAAVGAVGIEEGGERNGDPVVLALAEGLAFALADADDGVVFAVDADLFAERVFAAHLVVDDVGPDERDVQRRLSSPGVKPRPRSMLTS